MADFIIPENPEYTEEIRKLETTDPAHADLFNTIFQALINNDEFLKKAQEIHAEDTSLHTENEAAKFLKVNDIPEGTDVNDIRTIGFHHCSSNATAMTLINSPTKNAFFIIVGQAHGTYQEIVEYLPNPKRYMRNYYFATGWGDWQRVYSTADKPTASELGVLAATDPVITGSFSQNRVSGSQIGLKSFTACCDCKAIGDYASALGYTTVASGDCSHAEGNCTMASGDCSHAEGNCAVAEGLHSHSEGSDTVASGDYSHAEGYNSRAEATFSHAEGYGVLASGQSSHAEGRGTMASGDCSHAEGRGTVASGDCSHAAGTETTALDYQFAIGHFNNTTLAKASSSDGIIGGTLLVLGNGTLGNGIPVMSDACRITDEGAVIAKKAYQASGADYAERKEWLDGNPNAEDRRGYFVAMEGDKIKIASPEDFLIGVISANPCIIGNNDEGWMGQFLMDEFGDFIMEEIENTDDATGIITTSVFYKVNPEYDPNKEYIHRKDRKEWDCVGMLGFLVTRDDGTCQVNGYCTVADGGIATAAEQGYRVVERITNNLIKILFR